jgi:hypothetical protein
VIVPQYAPPGGMSPAEMRYLLTSASDRKTVAAVLAHLAARKVISIQPESGGYRITLLVEKPPAGTPPEEVSAWNALEELAGLEAPNEKQSRTIFLQPAQDKNLMLVASVVAGSLIKRVGSLYLRRNLRYSLPATMASIVIAMVTAAQIGRDGAAFLTLWFLFFSLILGLIFAANVVPMMRDAFRGMLSARNIAYIFLPLPIILALPGFVDVSIARASTPAFAWELVALVVLNIAGGTLIQTVTPLARERMDQVEGFKQFLASVELDPLNRMNDPHLSPELLNDHLAYCFSLNFGS